MPENKNLLVSVLYSGNSLAQNGAALYVNRFYKNAEKYKQNGIQIEICDAIHEFSDAKAYAQTKKFSRRQKIKSALKHSYIGNCLLEYIGIKHGKESILNNKNKIEKSDVLIANDMWCAYFAIKKNPAKPLIFIMHNSGDYFKMDFAQLPYLKKGIANKILNNVFNKVITHSGKILFVSETARHFFITQHPEIEAKTYFMPQCIENKDYVVDKDFTALNLVCVGTVGHRKNQFSILEALNELKNDSEFQNKYGNTKITLSLVGDGDELEKCKNYAKENNLCDVVLHGAQNDVPKYLNQANCFIFPSLDEGLPTVAIEAMRAGLSLIISDVGGCRELVDGNGILLKNGSVEEIIHGIKYMLDNKAEMSNMANKSRAMYESAYTIENMIKKYSGLVKELANCE